MKNYVQPGAVLTHVAPSGGVVAGVGYIIGAQFGVAVASAAEGADFELSVEGVVNLPKADTIEPGPGVKLYWIAADKKVTTSASGNTLIGTHAAKAAAAAAAATVPVRLGIVA